MIFIDVRHYSTQIFVARQEWACFTKLVIYVQLNHFKLDLIICSRTFLSISLSSFHCVNVLVIIMGQNSFNEKGFFIRPGERIKAEIKWNRDFHCRMKLLNSWKELSVNNQFQRQLYYVQGDPSLCIFLPFNQTCKIFQFLNFHFEFGGRFMEIKVHNLSESSAHCKKEGMRS